MEIFYIWILTSFINIIKLPRTKLDGYQVSINVDPPYADVVYNKNFTKAISYCAGECNKYG